MPPKRIIFFSTPAYGHILSVIPIIQSLVDQGHEVICYTTKEFCSFIKRTGAIYQEYEVDFASCMLAQMTANFFELTKALLTINRQAYWVYQPKIFAEQVDLILYDSMCSFAKNIAQKQQIKSVCLVTTLAFNLPVIVTSNLGLPNLPLFWKNRKAMRALQKEEKKFRKENRLPKLDFIDLFMNKGEETIVLSPKEFQPLAWTFPAKVHFAGTTIKKREQIFQEENETYSIYDYYISLGTIFTENKKILQEIIQQEYLQEKKIILVAGNLKLNDMGQNVIIAKRVNQIRLLPHCKYFVNHAGLNSVYESIYYQIPQICIPQQEEQKLVAKIVNRKKLGIYRKKQENVFQEIEKFRYQKEIAKMSETFRMQDGTKNATEIIGKLLERK